MVPPPTAVPVACDDRVTAEHPTLCQAGRVPPGQTPSDESAPKAAGRRGVGAAWVWRRVEFAAERRCLRAVLNMSESTISTQNQ